MILAGYLLVPSTVVLIHWRWHLSTIAKHARIIRLEEFQGRRQPQVLSSAKLTGEERAEVLAAMPYAPDFGTPGLQNFCAFRPHHRIVFVQEDGTATTLDFCFVCDALSFRQAASAHDPIVGTPFAWRRSLRRLFASHGMPGRRHYDDFLPVSPPPQPATNR